MFKDELHSSNRDPYEGAAEQYLRTKGLVLIERNFSVPCGEIDLIMSDKKHTIIFIEVKYRKHSSYGSGFDAVTKRKQDKLSKAANYFLLSHKLINHASCRFDIVSVSRQQGSNELTFDWLINAFEQSY
ncbi:putative endonuclease [Sinobacterium caligoides]|uniref:UPF0102 protein EDC56_3938 n=1 Tax=Sinobacterium caligoides TaxID=933926 RepID=A0A3N2D5M5_9GAMM|nr:YraN family protein [Sinobacterium caligoides]ROR94794.1 putative endonuclease [Sinobacterium caligoides]